MMDLRDFTSEALKQIVDGIEDAQKYVLAKGSNAAINPSPNSLPNGVMYTRDPLNAIDSVTFDIATTTEEASSEQGEAKISVLSVGVNGSLDSKSISSSSSRIKFLVRVAFPTSESN